MVEKPILMTKKIFGIKVKKPFDFGLRFGAGFVLGMIIVKLMILLLLAMVFLYVCLIMTAPWITTIVTVVIFGLIVVVTGLAHDQGPK